MTDPKYTNTLPIAFLALVLVGCGSAPVNEGAAANVGGDTSEDDNNGVVRYTVQQGDRLADISQDFTGNASNWPAIARRNNITNPSSLQVGQVLEIPATLIPGYERPSTTPVIQAESEQTAPNVSSPALALRKDAVDIDSVVVTPIDSNRDFKLNPIDTTAASNSGSYSNEGTQIKVIGTYYPKGIYSEPAAYSKLLMRVAPGTLFVLVSQINDWYRIETSDGQGYIRISDATVIE